MKMKWIKTIEAVLDAAKQWIPFTDVIVRQGEVKGFYGNRNSLTSRAMK